MDISVIIPCYNHGAYLLEAVNSVQDFKCTYEIIVVDDGSSDANTLAVLEQLKEKGVVVLHQENGGPSKARNTAIAVAKGDYILPLDSDNSINPLVFEKALDVLKANENITVVYTDAEYMGNKKGLWKVGQLDEAKIFISNQIDTCALIRKSDLIAVGGYDENKEIMSNEDWELWLKMLYNNKLFYYLEEVGFKYRVSEQSLSATIAKPKYKLLLSYLVKKYPLFYADSYKNILEQNALNKKKIRDYFKNNKIKASLKILLGRKVI
ncbi:Glycosyltransferase [unidentified eubacterium SCB49]|nr:Glycosyltransferase [unidentified eubacterium SCB49]